MQPGVLPLGRCCVKPIRRNPAQKPSPQSVTDGSLNACHAAARVRRVKASSRALRILDILPSESAACSRGFFFLIF